VKALYSTVLALCLALASAASAQAQVSMNDVTYLLPIPKTLDELKTSYLNASTPLSTGPLVSSANLKLFDWSTIQSDIDLSQRANIERLVVLGIRLDPCFKDNFSDACRPQIRLVLQPAVFTGTAPDTADTGIHLFFDTTQDQIFNLIRFASNYRNQFLGANSYKAPLQVNPVVSQEGVKGKFWQAMRPMIQNVLNQSTPSRIAFFVVQPNGRAWTFKSFDLFANGKTSKPIVIAGVNGATLQRIDNEISGSTTEFETGPGIVPRSVSGSDQTFDFLIDSLQFKRSNSSRIAPLQMTLDRLENPGTHLPGTIDCLSCHSTPAIRTNFRSSSINMNGTVARFISRSLPTTSLLNIYETHYEARDFRLLGYRNANPQIGQRVINESASIVDSLPRLQQ
jgi:hypothetical protein